MVDTLSKALFRSVEQFGNKVALLHKQQKQYVPITYGELYQRVFRCAAGLWSLGVRAGDRVAILSDNCPEWTITDWATLCIGAVTVPIYPTLTARQVYEIISDSEPSVIVAKDEKQVRKALEALESTKLHPPLVSIQPTALQNILSFEELTSLTSDLEAPFFRRLAQEIQPEEVATIIYTSGTTGEPKGSMLTHSNLISNIEAALQVLPIDHHDVLLSFLPLSHVFERMGEFLVVYVGGTIAYAESLFTLANDMLLVRPTVMLGVPRFYISFMDRVWTSVRESNPLKQKFFHWALRLGKEVARRWREGESLSPLLKLLHRFLDRLVGAPIRERTGGRIRFFVSGGAALPKEVAEFFHAFGLLILEGYGLTETSPVLTVNSPEAPRFGTVGKPLPGVQIRIADDGEILAKGPNVMKGYYNKPKETAEAIDPEGWFHTGDIGSLDKQGYLSITDRKKELLILANGKNVAPQPIENQLRTSSYIQEAVLFGDGMSAPIALIVPEYERVRQYAHEKAVPYANLHELLEHEQVQALFRAEIEQVNRQLADYERVRRFALLPDPFQIETGELTPTLKVKRRVIAQKYAHLIEQLR